MPTIEASELSISGNLDWLGLPRSFLNPSELEVLVALARLANARSALEIGCNTGRTAKLLLHHVPTIRNYIGIEVPREYSPRLQFQKFEIPTEPGLYVRGDPRFQLMLRAQGSFEVLEQDLPMVDFIFIDGDHSSEAVRHDSALAFAKINSGGVIVWHDYHDLAHTGVGVREVLDDFYDCGLDLTLVANTWLVAYCA